MTNNPSRSTAGQQVRVEARPTPISIDTARTAVLVIDMQNDFGAKGGMFDRAGIDVSMIQRAVEPTARVIAAARHAGLPIVYLKMGLRADLSDAGPVDGPFLGKQVRMGMGTVVRAPDGTESRILVRDTWNTEILPALAPQPGDAVVYKTRYSGFYNTELDAVLTQRQITYLIVTGCTTSVCVESTVRDAVFRDYSCVLLADCMAEPMGRSFPRTNHEASLHLVEALLGWVSESAAFVGALNQPR